LLNRQREDFIKEIRGVEAYNLRALSRMNEQRGQSVLSDTDLFPKFCFFVKLKECEETNDAKFHNDDLVDMEIGLRLFVTDKFLSEGQIECFENLFNYVTPSFPDQCSVHFDPELFFSKKVN
jgi:hypothetical protein